jgi:hypothetical protein
LRKGGRILTAGEDFAVRKLASAGRHVCLDIVRTDMVSLAVQVMGSRPHVPGDGHGTSR